MLNMWLKQYLKGVAKINIPSDRDNNNPATMYEVAGVVYELGCSLRKRQQPPVSQNSCCLMTLCR